MSEAATQHAGLTLTERAAERARAHLADAAEGSGWLRLSVVPGGCSGFEYRLDVEEAPDPDDFVFTSRGVRIAVDPFSLPHVDGTVIGYESSFTRQGFTFDNPQATGGCGCGESFAV